MKRRQWAIVGGAAILVLAVLLKNYLAASGEKKTPVNRSQKKLVEYRDLKAGSVAIRVPIDGPVQATEKIELYSEVSGIIGTESASFKEGKKYRKGDVLLSLDNAEAKSAYQSARSNYLSLVAQILPDLKLDFPARYSSYYQFLQKLNSSDGLIAPPNEKDEKLKLFLSGRSLYSSFQNAKASEIRLSKFEIRAPFDGTVTAALVESGQLVRPGQVLGEFIGGGSFEMVSSISPEIAEMVSVGDSVLLKSSGSERNFAGLVYRKNEKVDPATQSLQIFIQLNSQSVKDGEYLKGELRGKLLSAAMEIDRKLLIDEKHLFRIQDSTLVLQEVEILHRDPERVIISAPQESLRIPARKVTGAYPGMSIRLAKAVVK